MEEKAAICQTVMNRAPAVIHEDVAVFCSRGGGGTVVVGVSVWVSLDLKMK